MEILIKSKREMILEGIAYWQKKDRGRWNSSTIALYVWQRYGTDVSNNYVNMVRQDAGVSLYDFLKSGKGP